MIKQPKVSVFMPAYNQEHLIGESIESVINQTYTGWELVIGDDCSTDNTLGVAREYQKKLPEKIKVFGNKVNLGITGNCNELLKRCSGDYIAFTAGDDLFLPEKLEKQINLMESRPECVLSYHDVEVFDSKSGEVIRHWNSGFNAADPVTGKADDVAKMLVLHGTAFMSALSVVVRRSALPASGYDFRVPIASDWLMWIETCANSKGSVCFLDDSLARYRKHQGSITHNTREDITDQMVSLGIVEARYPWLREVARRRRGYEYYRQGVTSVLSNDFAIGRSQLLLGMRTYVWSWKSLAWWIFSWFKQVSS